MYFELGLWVVFIIFLLVGRTLSKKYNLKNINNKTDFNLVKNPDWINYQPTTEKDVLKRLNKELAEKKKRESEELAEMLLKEIKNFKPKHNVLFFLFFALSLFANPAVAYVGSYSDPIYIEIKTNPLSDAIQGLNKQTQQTMEAQRQNQLLQQQNNVLKSSLRTVCSGYFGDCYQQVCGGLNTGDASRESGCLQFVRSCCDRKINAREIQEQIKNNQRWESETRSQPQPVRTTVCPSGKVLLYGNVCACDIGNGYVGNDKGECVKINPTRLTPDQFCVKWLGANAKATGYTNSKGTPACNCQNGYQFNSGSTACVKIETPPAPTQPIIKPAAAPTKQIKPPAGNVSNKKPAVSPTVQIKQNTTSTPPINQAPQIRTVGDAVKDFFFNAGVFLKGVLFKR